MSASIISAAMVLLVMLDRHVMGAAPQDPCDPNPCGEGGDCYGGGSGEYKCDCKEGYEFVNGTCELVDDPCSPNPCDPYGECVPESDGRYYCRCKEGYIFKDGTCVAAKCPDCYQGQCADNPDLGAVAPGVMRTAEDLRAEMPEECQAEFVEDGDENGKIHCKEVEDKRVFYSINHRRWLWGDGNCCCPAHRYMRCPQVIYAYGRRMKVVLYGKGRQCWTHAICGIENGICRHRCVPVFSYHLVWVIDNGRYRWVYYRYASSCRCTDCHGRYCKDGFYLGDGIDGGYSYKN